MGVASAVVIGGCWGVWALVWLVTGVHTALTGPRTRVRAALVSPVVWGVLAVLVIDRVVPHRYWRTLRAGQPWLELTGMVILLGALAFTIWARRVLGVMWSSAPSVKSDHQLRTDGPYAITRHPIYTGMLAMVAGTALTAGLGRYLVIIPAALAVVLVKIRAEEQLMARTFPDAYPRYRAQVPMLLPGLPHLPGRPDRRNG